MKETHIYNKDGQRYEINNISDTDYIKYMNNAYNIFCLLYNLFCFIQIALIILVDE